MKIKSLHPKFVDHLPDILEEGILYISESFNISGHKCCCGCKEDVFLKLGPAKWHLKKNAQQSVSLSPSVGNWNYACQSHYWIRNNNIIEAGSMTDDEIEFVQNRDKRDRDAYIESLNSSPTVNRWAIFQKCWKWVTKTFRS